MSARAFFFLRHEGKQFCSPQRWQSGRQLNTSGNVGAVTIEGLVAESFGQGVGAIERGRDEREDDAVESDSLNNVLNANSEVARLTVWRRAPLLQETDSYGAIGKDGGRL